MPDLDDVASCRSVSCDHSDEEMMQFLNCDQSDCSHGKTIEEVQHGCKLGCLEPFQNKKSSLGRCLDHFLSSLQDMSKTEADMQIFDMLKGFEHDRVRSKSHRLQYSLWEHRVCRDCFMTALKIGFPRFDKLKRSIDSDLTTPRQDLRCMNGRDASIALHVDGYLFQLYWSIGLPDAKEAANDDLTDIQALNENASSSSSMPSAAKAGLEGEALNTRWLPHCTLTEIYEGYEQWCFPAAASRSTFNKVWAQWKSKLRILPPSHHAKCSVCEKLKTYMRKLSDPEKREECKQYHKLHVHDNLSDRRVQSRKALLSAECTMPFSTVPEEQSELSCVVDGMDMMKFKCPRNIGDSKELADAWRPKLHGIGCQIDGVVECIYVMDADQKKDANTMCQVIATSLDHADRVLAKRGVKMPTAVTFHSDNCHREMKNQTVAKFGSYLAEYVFPAGSTHTQQEVGHSHGPIDRRFGVHTSALARSDVLQDPDDFCNRLLEEVRPQANMEFVAERLPAVSDWKSFFETLNIKMMGHTATDEQDAKHVWKFIRRSACTQVTVEDTGGIAHPNDIILLTKDFMRSDELAQPPMVFARHDRLEACRNQSFSSLQLGPRTRLTEEAVKEYGKTIASLKKAPWKLTRAASYLSTWISENQNAEIIRKSDIRVVKPLAQSRVFFNGPSEPTLSPQHTLEVDWKEFAPRTLSQIRVVGVGKQPIAIAVRPPPAPLAAAKAGAARPPRAEQPKAAAPRPPPCRADAAEGGPVDPENLPSDIPAHVDMSLGCGKCRVSAVGCLQCKTRRAKRVANAMGLSCLTYESMKRRRGYTYERRSAGT